MDSRRRFHLFVPNAKERDVVLHCTVVPIVELEAVAPALEYQVEA